MIPHKNTLYMASVHVEMKKNRDWVDRGIYETVVKTGDDGALVDMDYVYRRAFFGKGATHTNIDKFRVKSVVVNYDTPLTREEFLNNN